MQLSQRLEGCDWVPRPRVLPLLRLGIETVEDLLTHYPRRYEDRREFAGFPHDESETPVCVCGEVTKTRVMRFGGWKKIFEATLQEPNANALSQPITLRWFNLHYVQKMIMAEQRLVVFGKPKLKGQRIVMDHPEFEVIENDEELSIHFRRITPIYPATEGLPQRAFRGLVYAALQNLETAEVETLLPQRFDANARLNALRQIHFPESDKALAEAREHLVFSEFFAMQMSIASRRAGLASRLGQPHCGPGKLLERVLRTLPFDLTNAQTRVIAEVRRDLASKQPMNRLLQGDVGSGKTVVATAAMLLAVEAGFQAALMAPTQILAEQHYAVLRRWLEPLGISIALRTGARQEESAMPLFNAARNLGSTGCHPVAPESLSGASAAAETRYSKRNLPHFERPWAKYVITFSTSGRRQLTSRARDIVLESLLNWNDRRYTLHAVCVMPDHVHVLLEPTVKTTAGETTFWSLSEIFSSIKRHTGRAINRAEATSGAVWDEEWFDQLIRSESDLQEKFHYITRNPVDAGLHEDGSYRWVWYPGIGSTSGARERRVGNPPPRDDIPCSPDAPHIVVGTHALLYEGVEFQNLGLVVIDEQHKFGVSQRALLTAREPTPDVLVMTATPIPRTLTMTVYGDLDVSTIDEMPANRGKIITAARENAKLGEVLTFMRGQLEAGRQAYIIYPLIEESEKLDAKAAATEFGLWCDRLRPFKCDLLHGRIPAPEKQAIMERFRSGETHALISTTVIEVGVDVPNATIMLVENAERFGLAQLHQLRGRIGRGEHKSYCILLSNEKTPEALAKLAVLEKTSNGFEVAEADWEQRGPGDLLGTAQSGLPGLKIGNLKTDFELMKDARAAATTIMEWDPKLEAPENQRFRPLVVEEHGRTFSNVS
ncbi:MAG TPA: DEAD/DEAH box helicase [Chthoniobacterales bacterium]|nr:DEAD/DEAH box helicase [Chthoniobacterales bacterium]